MIDNTTPLSRLARWFALGALAALASGCAIQATTYRPAVDNVDQIKQVAPPLAVGTMSVQPGLQSGASIGLRGNPMASPVGADYAAYLADALRQELSLAGKLDAASKISVGAVLVKNDIAAGGFSTNSGEIEARFTLTANGTRKFDKLLRADRTWDSSFVGAIAIPAAQQQYPMLVQDLLRKLFADADFIAALK
jgi:hypothetical protein